MGTFADIKDEALYRMLKELRKAPGLWLLAKSLKSLGIFIDGFLLGKSDTEKNSYYPAWYGEFTKYVLNVCVKGDDRYDIVNAIYENGYDDENGLNRYFKLLDDFCMEKYPKEESDKQSEAEESVLKEIRAAEIGYEEVCKLAQKYISDNFNKIFGIEEEEGIKSTREHLYLWDSEKENLKIIAYDRNDIKPGVNVEDIIKDVDISAETLLCDKPYRVIKIAGDEA